MTKIYTKLGDTGKTSLTGEVLLNKDDEVFEVIGSIDELNASLGVVKSFLKDRELTKKIEKIQNLLFHLSSEIADKKQLRKDVYLIDEVDINALEEEIDKWEELLPPLKNFLFPGNNKTSALIHLSRTVCRRTERIVIRYSRKEKIRPQIIVFMNRLSDWLFVMARITSPEDDKIWTV